MTKPDAPTPFRRLAGWLTLVTLAVTTGRLWNTERLYPPSNYAPRPDGYPVNHPDPVTRKWPANRPDATPMHSSNDRSRWMTVTALAERGTYVIGERDYLGDRKDEDGNVVAVGKRGLVARPQFGSVDVVLDPESQKFYSTKPPLLPTIVAGMYWGLRHVTDWSIRGNERWAVVCTLLFFVNVLPLGLLLTLLARLLDRFSDDDWAKSLLFAGACFGSFLATFSVTFSNHVPAAVLVTVAAYAALPPGGVRLSGGRLMVCGFAAGLASTFELPAAAFAAALGLWLLATDARRTLLYFMPAGLLPVAALLLTNYLAVGQVVPIYSKFGTEWYEYPGSHWRVEPGESKRGIDFADEPKGVYAFHLLFGHHGVFSLMPIWLLSWGGLMMLLSRRGGAGVPRHLAGLVAAVSLVTIAFYIQRTNNYGGWSSGPRWLFWLLPLWVVVALPAAEAAGRSKWGRRLAGLALAVSVFSAGYPAWNPWRHPWLYEMCEYFNWVRY